MEKGKRLFKNTMIVTIGKIATQLITFLLLPLYTYMLSTEEYGVIDLLNTLVSLMLPIVTFQIEQAVFRFLLDARDNQSKRSEIITNTIVFVIIQSAIFVFLFLIGNNWIHNKYKYFLMTNLLATMISSILLQISRGLGDNTRYAIGSFIVGTMTVILNVIFLVIFKLGAYGILIATLIGNIIGAIYIFISKKLFIYFNIQLLKFNKIKKMLEYSLPLVPNMISWWIVSTSDRLIITAFLGVAQNGIFSVSNKFSNIVASLYSVFNLTWTESAIINIEKEDKDDFFTKVFEISITFFGIICLGIIVVMPVIFQLLVNEKFAYAYYQIPILMIGSIFNILVSFLGSIYVAKKLTKNIAKTSMFAAIINIIINISLVHWFGLYAASLSTAIAYFIMFIYRYRDTKKYVNIQPNKRAIFSLVIMYILSMIVYYRKNIIYSSILLVLYILYAIYINRNNIKFIIEMINSKIKKISN